MIILNRVVHFLNTRLLKRFINHFEQKHLVSLLGYYAKDAILELPDVCTCPAKLFMYANTHIYSNAKFIIDPNGEGGQFVIKRNSGVAEGLTVITNTHGRTVGLPFKDDNGKIQPVNNKNFDVIIEEDVWIGTNVTLCAGVTIGRCSNIGAGSVVRHDVPPYAIVVGNPAKVVGFCFTPDEIIEHELNIFPEKDRLPRDLLEKNYEKYFLKRLKEIKEFSKL